MNQRAEWLKWRKQHFYKRHANTREMRGKLLQRSQKKAAFMSSCRRLFIRNPHYIIYVSHGAWRQDIYILRPCSSGCMQIIIIIVSVSGSHLKEPVTKGLFRHAPAFCGADLHYALWVTLTDWPVLPKLACLSRKEWMRKWNTVNHFLSMKLFLFGMSVQEGWVSSRQVRTSYIALRSLKKVFALPSRASFSGQMTTYPTSLWEPKGSRRSFSQ